MANTKSTSTSDPKTIEVPKDSVITPGKAAGTAKKADTTAAPGGKISHVPSTKQPTKDVYVKLSDVPHDILPKKTVSDLVNNSQISMHHKRKIWAQVNQGALSPDYAAAVKAIQLAASQGSQYRPGQDGL